MPRSDAAGALFLDEYDGYESPASTTAHNAAHANVARIPGAAHLDEEASQVHTATHAADAARRRGEGPASTRRGGRPGEDLSFRIYALKKKRGLHTPPHAVSYPAPFCALAARLEEEIFYYRTRIAL